jgi:hypothetical protein
MVLGLVVVGVAVVAGVAYGTNERQAVARPSSPAAVIEMAVPSRGSVMSNMRPG